MWLAPSRAWTTLRLRTLMWDSADGFALGAIGLQDPAARSIGASCWRSNVRWGKKHGKWIFHRAGASLMCVRMKYLKALISIVVTVAAAGAQGATPAAPAAPAA